MHELGIVFYIIKDVKEAAAQNAVDHIDAVVMDIGKDSTIVPEYLQDMWRWAADREDVLKGSELKINGIPAVSWCDSCKSEYGTVAHGKLCPNCGSDRTWLLRGNEVEIKEIQIQSK